jgi:hypothetical protein
VPPIRGRRGLPRRRPRELFADRGYDHDTYRWVSPHPPGTHFNIDRRTRAEVVDERTVRLHLPEVDGLALGKLRATHVMNERFWRDLGFGYARDQTGEGHW